jgi:hypothetical protein
MTDITTLCKTRKGKHILASMRFLIFTIAGWRITKKYISFK